MKYESPTEYILKKIQNGEKKGNIRIYVTNMLMNSYLESDKSFYSRALAILDNMWYKLSYNVPQLHDASLCGCVDSAGIV